MKFVLFAFVLFAAPAVHADEIIGIQNCAEIDLNFKDVKQVRDFGHGEIRLYLIDKMIGEVRTNGVAITYGNFCRYINGFFYTDLNEALPLTGLAPDVDRVRLKLLVPKREGSRLTWMTVRIKKRTESDRPVISAWLR